MEVGCAHGTKLLSDCKECKKEITTDGRKHPVIGTGPKTPPPPVAVEALPLHVQQSIKHF